ncbi:nucleotidyltransferase family protein [Puia sp. P3]|uniref:nucleotidyltransferase family protein n=1 Tax=Puia sp. P3 TaxID=3423952 RepID=UPI003D666E7E
MKQNVHPNFEKPGKFLVNLTSMYTTSQILSILKEKKEYLQKRYPISELGIFGSYARGDFNEKSDIDILVDFNGSIDGFEYIRLAHELEDTFNQKIDVVSRKGIKPQYLPYVEKSLIHV